MKYILIPLLTIIFLILGILLIPFRILFNLIMSFKWIGWREAFTFGEDCLFDANFSDLKNLCSKECTDDFCDRF